MVDSDGWLWGQAEHPRGLPHAHDLHHHALRTRRYDSTWYIPGTIHKVENDPMEGGRRYSIQSPILSSSAVTIAK